MFTDYCFLNIEFDKLIALILRTNKASTRVFEKAGFQLREIDDYTANWEFDVYEKCKIKVSIKL